MQSRALLGALLIVCSLAGAAPAVAGARSLRSVRAVAAGPWRAVVPDIIGGAQISVAEVPWQAYVLLVDETEGGLAFACGGSILDATHVLTAAHCVVHQATSLKYPASDVTVVAGATDVSAVLEGMVPPGAQRVAVAEIRTHPYYQPAQNSDDVAVLRLSAPLELAGANAKAIPLAPTGLIPPAGTPLGVSGYGRESASGPGPDNKLYAATLTAIDSDTCRETVGSNSAVVMCAGGATSATCQGDSGGPLTIGMPQQLIGVVDYGPVGCPVNQPDGFANLSAMEIRAFVEGSESPPIAPRPNVRPTLVIHSTAPVTFSPLTCEPGTWSGSPSFTYSFQSASSPGQSMQSGASDRYIPPRGAIGMPILCVVHATNAGGTSTARTGTTPPMGRDSAPPVSAITSVKCHQRNCSIALRAFDPNDVALSVRASASYRVPARCSAATTRSARHRTTTARRSCYVTVRVAMVLTSRGPDSYLARTAGLPYGRRISFAVRVINAAGLSSSPVIYRTLQRPPARKSTLGH